MQIIFGGHSSENSLEVTALTFRLQGRRRTLNMAATTEESVDGEHRAYGGRTLAQMGQMGRWMSRVYEIV